MKALVLTTGPPGDSLPSPWKWWSAFCLPQGNSSSYLTWQITFTLFTEKGLVAQMLKNLSTMPETGSTSWSRRSPGERNGYPLQYSCLENSMDRGAWWATVHWVPESDRTEQLTFHFFFLYWKLTLCQSCWLMISLNPHSYPILVSLPSFIQHVLSTYSVSRYPLWIYLNKLLQQPWKEVYYPNL